MFRNLFLAAALMFLAVPAFAQNPAAVNPCADIAEATRDKSSMEVDTILKACRKAEADKPFIAIPDAEDANSWADAAKGFGEALGIAAKELGIAANDFLNSPAGWLLAFILLFNYAGGAVVGVPMTLFILLFWWNTMKRVMRDRVEYTYVPVLWGLFSIRRVSSLTSSDSGYWGPWAILSSIGLLIIMLIIWTNVT